ncbi:MAG: MFS transporter [Xanthomonadales bacterium]|nr:MFS transporter [Xanthomonadales bacterium]
MTALIAGRALQGCGAIAGVAMALAADVTRPERRPVIMAIIGIGIGGAFLLSMALSVPLATLLGLEGLFWLTALLAVLGMALVLTLPTPPLPEPEVDTGGSAAALPVWLLALSVFLLHGAMTLLFVILPPMLVNDFGLALPQHWKLYVPTMLASVIVLFPLLRRVGRKLGEHRMIPWAFVAIAFSMALIPFSSAWAVLGLLVTVYFLGFNLLEAGMPALLSRITGSRGRGRRMGLYSTFQFLGAFFGGVSGGLLLSAFGGPSALLSAGVVCGVWGLLLRAFSTRFFPTGSTV